MAHSALFSSPCPVLLYGGRGGVGLSRRPRSGYLLLPSFSLCKEREFTGCWKEWIGRGNEWTRMEEGEERRKREEEVDICPGWRRMEERKRDWKRLTDDLRPGPQLALSHSHSLTHTSTHPHPHHTGGEGGRSGRASQGTGATRKCRAPPGVLLRARSGTYTTPR